MQESRKGPLGANQLTFEHLTGKKSRWGSADTSPPTPPTTTGATLPAVAEPGYEDGGPVQPRVRRIGELPSAAEGVPLQTTSNYVYKLGAIVKAQRVVKPRG